MQKLLLNGILMSLILAGQMGGPAWSATDKAKADSVYLSLGEPLVLNLSSQRSRNTYLQLTADVLIRDSDSEAIIKTHIPAMRHQLIVLLSEQSENDMKSPEKREEIRKTATAEIKALITELSNNKDVSVR